MITQYNNKLRQRARGLRKESTLSEVLLWKHLNKKQIEGYQFLRQKPLNNYIVDFYCPRLKLIVEIDGSSHNTKQEYDSLRDEHFKLKGLHTLRFTDLDVKNNIEAVIREIREFVLQ